MKNLYIIIEYNEDMKERPKTKIRDIFGILKFKESTDKIMKEVDKDLWGEE